MLRKTGVEVIEQFLSGDACEDLLRQVASYRSTRELPLISRRQPGRSLHYMVIDGAEIQQHFPQLVNLNQNVQELASQLNAGALVPLRNLSARININVTPPSGEYRWHYDRNRVTAILYLNQVDGGETEMYPNHRLHLGRWKHTRPQRWLDSLWTSDFCLRRFARKLVVSPRQGMLIVMRGDRCLHSVCRVQGREDRINIIMTFDAPDARFPVEGELDSYLYTRKPSPAFDPNYQR